MYRSIFHSTFTNSKRHSIFFKIDFDLMENDVIDGHFSYTGQENPTGSVVLDFSVWYCLSGTELPVCYFMLICRAGVREK